MKDTSRLDLLAAILGTLGVLLLLVAAFAAAAQEPPAPASSTWRRP
jgi:hypothetical protein